MNGMEDAGTISGAIEEQRAWLLVQRSLLPAS